MESRDDELVNRDEHEAEQLVTHEALTFFASKGAEYAARPECERIDLVPEYDAARRWWFWKLIGGRHPDEATKPCCAVIRGIAHDLRVSAQHIREYIPAAFNKFAASRR